MSLVFSLVASCLDWSFGVLCSVFGVIDTFKAFGLLYCMAGVYSYGLLFWTF